MKLSRLILVLLLGLVSLFAWMPQDEASAAEKKGAADKKRVVFMAGSKSHGYGSHEHYAGCILLAKALQKNMPNIEVEVYRNGWPKDPNFLDGADALVMYSDGGGGHPVNDHLEQVDKLAKKGLGIVCIHYAVEVPASPTGERFLDWIGGYFEANWSVNPHWTAKFDKLPKHPITRGVKPIEINDEWYYHMRFRKGMKGVTPILTALPPKSTLTRPDGPHSGNPHVRAAIARGEAQHVAWAAERPDGGRGFGFTGGHFHWNWGDENFRKLVLNAIVWTAQAEVPVQGVSDQPITLETLKENQDYEPPKNFDGEAIRKRLKLIKKTSDAKLRSAEQAVANLDVAEGLEATLFAAEPDISSLTNLDIDHRGRIWVCDVENYRHFRNTNNKVREAGDRILILEDTDGDGKADKQTVFYQGRDIDSAMGICVLGDKVYVSCAPNILVFTDADGDDKPEKKELLFTNTGQPQHDHSAHSFSFGPDGKLYWNFGNTGKQVCDKDGKTIVDKAGNAVVDNGEPYFGGMPFRCNLDGSEFEVLGHNFRNNYETAVDSFGTIWQSDNDDDGNRGVRINYVMEFGNFGYLDEVTGAGWRVPRTGMFTDTPHQHWHLRDPGVVPNMLQTGAGSPTGIMVYEGRLLPKVFWDQVIHCDAGPNVVRAYPATKDGAGYKAKIVNILHGARDNWFRPADVCTAPDGSIFVTDWYDPGVGGHAQGDLDRGRLFRVAPPGHKYKTPKFDFSTAKGAVIALQNPNLSARYMAWNALTKMGVGAEKELLKLYENADNPRHRARALWILGKMEGRGPHYIEAGIRDANPDLRIVGIRLARQTGFDVIPVVRNLVNDKSPEVRRECAIALRHNNSPDAAGLWAQLASQYDGKDRWYLEALGISADKQWDAFLAAWLDKVDNKWDTPAGRDIVWRSRSKNTPQMLAKLIADPDTSAAQLPRYFRALDFHGSEAKDRAIAELAFADHKGDQDRTRLIAAESINRIKGFDLSNRPKEAAALDRTLAQLRGTGQFVSLVDKFNVAKQYPELLKLAQKYPSQQLGVEATVVLLAKGQQDLFKAALASKDVETSLATVEALGASADGRSAGLLLPLVKDAKQDAELRRQATRALAKTRGGALQLLQLAKAGKLDQGLKNSAAFGLNNAPWKEVQSEAVKLFPLPASKNNKRLPPVSQLLKLKGVASRGKIAFTKTAECAKCHVVRKEGKEVGPNLTEIGSKLSRQAFFESIIYPSAGISHNYETYAVALEDGNVVSGVMISRTPDSITLKTSEAIVRTFKTSEIEELVKQEISLMPADLQKTMTTQDLVDVVEYLTTLKKTE